MPSLRLSELCNLLSENGLEARYEGEDLTVRAVNTLAEAGDGDLSFFSNPRYLHAVRTTRASAVILKDGFDVPAGLSTIRCPDPYGAVTVAIATLHGYRSHPCWGASPEARIDPTATVGEGASIAPGATIAAGARLGRGCTVYPGCYVGNDVRVGDECTLYPNVVIYEGSVLGDRVTLHSGTVIGEDGLGYAPRNGTWTKIPMVGQVVIEDDVEIGANCTIDRGTLGITRIGAGTKLGNLNVVGHGSTLGRDCILVGQVGLAGSVTVGDGVIIKGQAGVSGHLSIGDEAVVGPMSGVADDVPAGDSVFGIPATRATDAHRSVVALKKLPEALRRIRELERELVALRRAIEDAGE